MSLDPICGLSGLPIFNVVLHTVIEYGNEWLI
jgi:hypothetical protein